jgi:WD40 repeat protein
MKGILPLLLVVLLGCVLSSCSASASTTAVPSSVPLTMPLTATSTMAASVTPLPTITATVTATPTPSATPTLALPVSNGTPVPVDDYETITAENFADLKLIARYGYANTIYWQNAYRLIEDGQTAVVGMSDGLLFYDTTSGQQTDKLSIDLLRNYDITPDGRFILALAGDQLQVLDRSGEILQSFDPSLVANADMWSRPPFAISGTGKWVAIAEIAAGWQRQNDTVHVFQVEDGQEVAMLPGNLPTFSPDDTYLAVLADYGSYAVPYLYTTTAWEKTGKLSMCENVRCELTFSPDSSILVLAQPGQVILYRTNDRKTLQWLQGWKFGSEYDPAKVSFSANSQYVLVYSQPGGRYAYAQKPTIFEMNLSNSKVTREEIDFKALAWPGEDGQIHTFEFMNQATWWFNSPAFLLNNAGTVLISDSKRLCQNEVCETLDGHTLLDEEFNRYTVEANDLGQTLVRNSQGETVMTLPFKANYLEQSWLYRGYLVANLCPTETREGCFGVLFNPKGQRLYWGDFCQLAAARQEALFISCYANGGYSNAEFFITPSGVKKFTDFWGMPAISPDLNLTVYEEYWINGESVKEKQLLTYAPDGKMISAEPMPDALQHGQSFAALYFPDGQGVLVDVNGKTCTTSGVCRWLNNGPIRAIAFSPNGKLLATYGDDGFIRVWAVRKQ